MARSPESEARRSAASRQWFRDNYATHRERITARRRGRLATSVWARVGALRRAAQHRATTRGLPFDLDQRFLMNLYFLQGGTCAYTGLPFTLLADRATCPSIDRVNAERGYTKDNVQFVSAQVNFMKRDLTHEQFTTFCAAVAERYE